MNNLYSAALATATDPTVNTQWQHERPNIPPVNHRHVPVLKDWLHTLDSPTAQEPHIWQAVKANWVSFLAATGKCPSSVLAPNRKRVQWGAGIESEASAKKRFREDRRERTSIQGALWRLFDSKEVLVERWPHEPRVMMNRIVDDHANLPFYSLMDDFGKQRRFNSVWSSLICFLVYCNEEDGSVKEMGLHLSEDLQDDLIDIQQALMFENYPKPGDAGRVGLVEQSIGAFIMNIVTDPKATPSSNPLLWWMVVLVRSSLEAGPDDFISRGHFSINILPMDLDIQHRLEGILHFVKVFLLDLAFSTWEPKPKSQLLEVQDALNAVDNSWVGTYSSPRPSGRPDRRTCQTPAWKSILAHIEETFARYTSRTSGTPAQQVILLRRRLREVE